MSIWFELCPGSGHGLLFTINSHMLMIFFRGGFFSRHRPGAYFQIWSYYRNSGNVSTASLLCRLSPKRVLHPPNFGSSTLGAFSSTLGRVEQKKKFKQGKPAHQSILWTLPGRTASFFSRLRAPIPQSQRQLLNPFGAGAQWERLPSD